MIKSKLMAVLKRGHVPKDLVKSDYFKIMHISDTPESTYEFIQSLIEKVEPDYIIHTGDLVDNIKLQIRPGFKQKYKNSLSNILKILESSGAKTYIIPGNQDHLSSIKKLSESSEILKPNTTLKIKGYKFLVAHSPEEITEVPDVDQKLYGHNYKSLKNGLNGLSNVNFILLPSFRIFKIDYPRGTRYERGYKTSGRLL